VRTLLLLAAALVVGVTLGRTVRRVDAVAAATPLLSVEPYRFSLDADDGAAEAELKFYKQRCDRNPSAQDLASLGYCYLCKARRSGEPAWYLLAHGAAERSLAMLPHDNITAEIVEARVAEARHDFKDAIRMARHIIGEKPSLSDGHSILVSSCLGVGDIAAARPAADDLLRISPTMTSFVLSALVDVQRGDDAAALKQFQRGFALEEGGDLFGSAWARTLLGRFYFQRGRLTLAGDLFHEALRILPQYPNGLLYAAEYEARIGHYDLAEQELSEAYKVAPMPIYLVTHVEVKQARGDVAGAAMMRDEAEHELRRQISDNAFGHRRDLARLLLGKQTPAADAEALQLIEDETKQRRDADTLDILGEALRRNHRLSEARAVCDEALARGVRDARLSYHAGLVARDLHETSRAVEYFQAAERIDPTSDAGRASRQELLALK
jgi:tetratricopeptide (TPR) repeat protein